MPVLDFAGLTKKELNLLVFETSDQLRSILARLGIKTDGGRILLDSGDVHPCESCKKDLGVDNLGHVMPGSTLMFCDDPACMTKYVLDHLPDDA